MENNIFEKIHTTQHYIFNYHENSEAEKDITNIANMQEKCYEKITKQLGITYADKIEYFLCNTPKEVGMIYGDGENCNGFARLPNKIYAVYSEKIKCVGPHEDVHIISYQINKPDCAFLSEGLAMYFDEVWCSIPNERWCKYYLELSKLPSIAELMQNEYFYSLKEEITYPIAGSFVSWIFNEYSKDIFLEVYSQKDCYSQKLEDVLGISIIQIDEQFRKYISHVVLDKENIAKIQNI